MSEAVHKAAINMLNVSQGGLVVTGSADKTLKLFDLKMGLAKPLAVMNCTDAVFCGEVVGELAIAGCGDGNILAFDLQKGGECLYGYGADEVGAIHCMKVMPDLSSLLTGGDSGQPLKIIFSGF